ncbi:hypothetical protein F2Q70_00031797 [Brassica cretica]|uniref:Uncharacterized protein n=1 Tax=Brassica cretica TaxID=69181 RepID=A0A8S9FI88_BRACR|nr:hypothetical protein F2Q70_00031797 [Brassica cretica]
MGTTACCHQESSPVPPHARTSSSSSSPSTAAQATIVFLSSRRSHIHRPRLNRSPDEAARASGGFISTRAFRARAAAVAAGKFPIRLRLTGRLGQIDFWSKLDQIWSLFEQLEFIDTTFPLLSAMSGSMDYGVASHTSLSDSPVANPSLFPFSGGDGCRKFWYQSGVPSRFRPGWRSGDSVFIVKSSSFVLRLTRFSPDVQQLRDVQVRQFSQELSVSSVMISRQSRSGYVTFLPPAHFKQSFHEFCYWRLCGVWYEPLHFVYKAQSIRDHKTKMKKPTSSYGKAEAVKSFKEIPKSSLVDRNKAKAATTATLLLTSLLEIQETTQKKM